MPLWGLNLTVYDSINDILGKSFPYVLDGERRGEVVKILTHYPELNFLSHQEDRLKITKSLFHETSRKGYAVFLHGKLTFERDKEYRKIVFEEYAEKIADALNLGELTAINFAGVSSLDLRPVAVKDFHSDWVNWEISFNDCSSFFRRDFVADFWNDFLEKNVDCKLNEVFLGKPAVADKILESDDVDSQGYVKGLIKEYLKETFWNISRGGPGANFSNEEIFEKKEGFRDLVGNKYPVINPLSLEKSASISGGGVLKNSIESKLISEDFPRSQSGVYDRRGLSSESNKVALTNFSGDKSQNEPYLNKSEIARLMSIGVSTLAQYTNGHSEFHLPFPAFTIFGKKKVWKSSEVYEWIEDFRVWKMRKK